MDTILPDKISYEEIQNKRAFWYYFFAVHYDEMLWQVIEDDAGWQTWIMEFTSLRERGHFQYIHTIFLQNGMWISCYPDQMQYQYRKLPREKMQEKRAWDWDTFLRQTESWSVGEQLLCIPIVVIRPQEKEEFTQWVKCAIHEIMAKDCMGTEKRLTEEDSFVDGSRDGACMDGDPEDDHSEVQFDDGMDYSRIVPLILQKQFITWEEQREKKRGKQVRVWMILFGVLILHFFLFPRLLPTHDTMGQEGLKRVIVQGIAVLPAMYCLAGTILAEGILWFLHKKQNMAEIGKGRILIWLFLLCVNGWWCATESCDLLGAVQDWKIMKEAESAQEMINPWERDGIDRVSFRSWKIQETSSGGKNRGYYLKNSARTFTFPIGNDPQRKQNIENYADRELTVYYYHHSHVPVRIYAGDQILAGDQE